MRSSEFRAGLDAAREQTDALFQVISPAALYERPVAERHRIIFYLGHLDAFDWNVLARRSKGEKSFHPAFDSLFERGIDPPPGAAPVDVASDWPSRREIEKYSARTRQWIDAHLDELDPWAVQMTIEHRLMHAETLAYLMHNLPYSEKSGDLPIIAARTAPPNPMVRIAAGTAVLGQDRDSFGWDNEHLRHEVHVPAFAISRYKISNGEYLEFVGEGGSTPNFWTRDGGQRAERWMWRSMFGEVPLQLDWPVWVTWEQAHAYAVWKGADLPSEAQWRRASERASEDAALNESRDNFGSLRWDPVAVDSACGNSGPVQTTGNGWEWTRDLFAPFRGFEPHPFYPGYSADFFDDKHYVMKGASPRTAALLTRPAFRNWFRPDYPYMYAGFRLIHPEE